jgi:hypothetical protein
MGYGVLSYFEGRPASAVCYWAHAGLAEASPPVNAYSGVYWCYSVLILFEGHPVGCDYLPGAVCYWAHAGLAEASPPVNAYSGFYWCYGVLTFVIYTA